MFTGLVQAVGLVRSVQPAKSGLRLAVDLAGLPVPPRLGDSIALSGVCCTVVSLVDGVAEFDLSRETLARTWLGQAVVGEPVNLEGALRAGDPLGGHLVQGHVDALASVAGAVDPVLGGDWLVRIPADLLQYCVVKGSITLDGVSLTIAGVEGEVIRIALIPHTTQVTTLGRKPVGALLHVEVDILAKYVERMLAARLGVATPAGLRPQS
jgi:riboflavin synthase